MILIDEGKHSLRVLKPMIATQECLLCHANHKVDDVVGVIELSFSLDATDELITDASFFLLGVSIAVLIVTILAVLLVVKRVTNPLNVLRDDLKEFFAFIAHERDDIKPFKVDSHDEIGLMVHSINENIEKTVKGFRQDIDCDQTKRNYL